MMHEQACCCDDAANHQLPIVAVLSLYYTSELMKNIEVVFVINCLAWRGVLVMDKTFPIKKHS